MGSASSFISGCISLYIATETNIRVTYTAFENKRHQKLAYQNCFNTAYKGSCAIGFSSISIALSMICIIIHVYIKIVAPTTVSEYKYMFEIIAGFGLGSSTVSFIYRVGGGIYTKAIDIGSDLIGKSTQGLDDDIMNNSTILDLIGDCVGDIIGVNSDLYGSFSECICAVLFLSSYSPELIIGANFFWPLILLGSGIIVCIITSCITTTYIKTNKKEEIKNTLYVQLIISTILTTIIIALLSNYGLPDIITFFNSDNTLTFQTNKSNIMYCALMGLYSGISIQYFTNYYTSDEKKPVQDLAYTCKMEASLNILDGISLGYNSSIIPVLILAITLYTSFKFAGLYGISIATTGILSNVSICIIIDVFGYICDNAKEIANLVFEDHDIISVTNDLDSAGNSSKALVKMYTIGSACLVSLTLFGAFVLRTDIIQINILEPIIMASLMIGAMTPYCFSSLTLKSVVSSGEIMVFINNIVQ
jgi:inorganic pyrophosphatase